MTASPQKIYIICGELSGESHTSRVVTQLYIENPKLKIRAMGSSILRKLGVEIAFDYKDYSFNGLTQVVLNIFTIFKLKEKIIADIKEFKPDLVLGVDYSGFNLEIAKTLKEEFNPETKPLFYQYIAPQLWASRPHRIKKVKDNVDKILLTLPFEVSLYEKENIPHKYVGNPVYSSMAEPIDKPKFLSDFYQNRQQYSADPEEILIGIFPGSRAFEIEYLMPEFIKAARDLKKIYPKIKFVLARATGISSSQLFKAGLEENYDEDGNSLIEILEPKMMLHANQKLLSAADFLWLCSGTVTLEAALYKKPYFLTYKADFFSYQLYKILRSIEMAGLANIIAGEYLVKEFIQGEANAKNYIKETQSMIALNEEKKIIFSNKYKSLVENFTKIHQQLNKENSAALVATEITSAITSLQQKASSQS